MTIADETDEEFLFEFADDDEEEDSDNDSDDEIQEGGNINFELKYYKYYMKNLLSLLESYGNL